VQRKARKNSAGFFTAIAKSHFKYLAPTILFGRKSR
jgi:hypothetical protein